MQVDGTDSLARALCRQLFETTDGRTMEWRRAISELPLEAAVEYGVVHGWLLFDAHDSSICLTDEGRRQVRRTLS